MISSAVVNRYANALADVVLVGRSKCRRFKPAQAVEQLRAFDEAVASSSDLRSVLASPAIPVARKRAIIKDIAEKLGFARVVAQFRSRRERSPARLPRCAQIVEAFEELSRCAAWVCARGSAFGFRIECGISRTSLAGQLGHLAGAQVRMRFVVDPDLIGGVTAKIGSRVYDGSVRGQLADMRKRLSAVQ